MVAIQNLERGGGTINITGLSGGNRPHIVADEASCHIEVRAERQTTLNAMTDELHRIISEPHIEGTSLEFKKISGRPAMEFNDGTEKTLVRRGANRTGCGRQITARPYRWRF